MSLPFAILCGRHFRHEETLRRRASVSNPQSLVAAPFPRVNTCPRAYESEQILSLLLSSCDAILRWWVWGQQRGLGGAPNQE